MTRYRIEFDDQRISRRHDVEPIEIDATDADDIAEQVYAVARRICLSREIAVDVEMGAAGATGTGYITAGMHTAGRFSITTSEAR